MKKILTVLLVLTAFPAASQELNPLQQFLYNESGYAPPQLAHPPAAAPSPYATAYAPAPVQPQVYYAPAAIPAPAATPEGYYEDEGSEVGPSSDAPTLRGLLTSSGF